jgi:hypothetical protein
MFLSFMFAETDEKVITIVQDMNDLFSKGNEEAIFGDAGDAVVPQKLLGFLLLKVLSDDCLVGLEDDGKSLADSDGDRDGCNEPHLSVSLDCHFYLLQDHQQLTIIIG